MCARIINIHSHNFYFLECHKKYNLSNKTFNAKKMFILIKETFCIFFKFVELELITFPPRYNDVESKQRVKS